MRKILTALQKICRKPKKLPKLVDRSCPVDALGHSPNAAATLINGRRLRGGENLLETWIASQRIPLRAEAQFRETHTRLVERRDAAWLPSRDSIRAIA